MTKVALFHFGAESIRVVDRAGNPWFVAGDACRILGLDNVGQALARLDDDEKSSISANIISGDVAPAGGRAPAIISESGLYSLILTSRKPDAKAFRRWVTGEVLPAIRRTGRYDPHADTLRQHIRALNAATSLIAELRRTAGQRFAAAAVPGILKRFGIEFAEGIIPDALIQGQLPLADSSQS